MIITPICETDLDEITDPAGLLIEEGRVQPLANAAYKYCSRAWSNGGDLISWTSLPAPMVRHGPRRLRRHWAKSVAAAKGPSRLGHSRCNLA